MRKCSRAARPSLRVDRCRHPATVCRDGWSPLRCESGDRIRLIGRLVRLTFVPCLHRQLPGPQACRPRQGAPSHGPCPGPRPVSRSVGLSRSAGNRPPRNTTFAPGGISGQRHSRLWEPLDRVGRAIGRTEIRAAAETRNGVHGWATRRMNSGTTASATARWHRAKRPVGPTEWVPTPPRSRPSTRSRSLRRATRPPMTRTRSGTADRSNRRPYDDR